MLASVVNFFNPSLIVIGGGVANSPDQLLAAIRETVYRRSLPLATRELLIQRSSLGGLAGVIGASSMVVDQLFSRDSIGRWLAAGDPSELRGAAAGGAEALQPPATTRSVKSPRRRVLEDQLRAAVGQDLALDDRLALVRLGDLRDPRRRAASPLEELDRLPGAALRRSVRGVHDGVHDIAVVERLARRPARLHRVEHVGEHVDVAELRDLVADREQPAGRRLRLLGDIAAAAAGA